MGASFHNGFQFLYKIETSKLRANSQRVAGGRILRMTAASVGGNGVADVATVCDFHARCVKILRITTDTVSRRTYRPLAQPAVSLATSLPEPISADSRPRLPNPKWRDQRLPIYIGAAAQATAGWDSLTPKGLKACSRSVARGTGRDHRKRGKMGPPPEWGASNPIWSAVATGGGKGAAGDTALDFNLPAAIFQPLHYATQVQKLKFGRQQKDWRIHPKRRRGPFTLPCRTHSKNAPSPPESSIPQSAIRIPNSRVPHSEFMAPPPPLPENRSS